ncbi:MAG: hypothetical protein M3Y21_01190 [Candidatus Eremiobacteraeota bacterium]|nr:hypothetical protein [Candidatus Eremiobacteraeota bacterium]
MKDVQTPRAGKRPEHLFVVRVWSESAAEPRGQWRGSVAHVSSGQKLYFANLGDLTEFIMLRRDDPEIQSAQTDPAQASGNA